MSVPRLNSYSAEFLNCVSKQGRLYLDMAKIYYRQHLNGVQCCRNLYNLAFTRNSPSRMRTVTSENQYQRLLESVTPLSKFPYTQQLQIKRTVLERALKKVVNIMKYNRRIAFTPELEEKVQRSDGCICPLADMKPSPQSEEFRNKEEFRIKLGPDGDANTVGLVIGRGEHHLCVPCDGLSNQKPLHKQVAKSFKSFLDQSRFKKRADRTAEGGGHWRSVLVRSNEAGQVMLVPDLSCREITEDLVNQAKDELLNFYTRGSDTSPAIHSLYIRVRYRGREKYHSQHHLHGDTHIFENVLGYKFRISPDTFFQLNTPGAEVLYSEVQRLVKSCCPQALLDVGCGTGEESVLYKGRWYIGTIGILTSSLVQNVIGLDLMQQAIWDAEFNARLNDVQNARFLVGNVRKLLKTFLEDGKILTSDMVAVVNPNRNGLSWKAIQRLRCSETIKHLIFISCKPHGNALVNIVDLITPESDDHLGKPFMVTQAIGVDMFPHTVHSELVLLFQR